MSSSENLQVRMDGPGTFEPPVRSQELDSQRSIVSLVSTSSLPSFGATQPPEPPISSSCSREISSPDPPSSSCNTMPQVEAQSQANMNPLSKRPRPTSLQSSSPTSAIQVISTLSDEQCLSVPSPLNDAKSPVQVSSSTMLSWNRRKGSSGNSRKRRRKKRKNDDPSKSLGGQLSQVSVDAALVSALNLQEEVREFVKKYGQPRKRVTSALLTSFFRLLEAHIACYAYRYLPDGLPRDAEILEERYREAAETGSQATTARRKFIYQFVPWCNRKLERQYVRDDAKVVTELPHCSHDVIVLSPDDGAQNDE